MAAPADHTATTAWIPRPELLVCRPAERATPEGDQVCFDLTMLSARRMLSRRVKRHELHPRAASGHSGVAHRGSGCRSAHSCGDLPALRRLGPDEAQSCQFFVRPDGPPSFGDIMLRISFVSFLAIALMSVHPVLSKGGNGGGNGGGDGGRGSDSGRGGGNGGQGAGPGDGKGGGSGGGGKGAGSTSDGRGEGRGGGFGGGGRAENSSGRNDGGSRDGAFGGNGLGDGNGPGGRDHGSGEGRDGGRGAGAVGGSRGGFGGSLDGGGSLGAGGSGGRNGGSASSSSAGGRGGPVGGVSGGGLGPPSNGSAGSKTSGPSTVGTPAQAATPDPTPSPAAAAPRVSEPTVSRAAVPSAPAAAPPAPSQRPINVQVTPTLTALRPGSGVAPALPPALVPLGEGSGRGIGGTFEPPRGVARRGASLTPRVGTPVQVVRTCRTSIVNAALPYGAVRVDAVSAGRPNHTLDGGLVAPIEVRVVYARASARQMRQSRVACRLDATGVVVALR